LGYLLIGLLALLMDSALGFAAGYLLPGRFTAPLVAVALWVAHLLPMGAMDYESGVVLLSPAAGSNMTGADPFYEQARLAPWQIPIFGGLGAAALATVALKGGGKRKVASLALAASLVMCAVGVVAALRTENPYSYFGGQEAASFEYACEEGGITVCIHPAYEKDLPEATRTVNEVAEPLVGISVAPTRALQVNGPKTMPDETENVALFGLFDPWGNLSKESVAFGFVQDETMMYGPNSTQEGKFSEEDL
jgi:hypothetical protein